MKLGAYGGTGLIGVALAIACGSPPPPHSANPAKSEAKAPATAQLATDAEPPLEALRTGPFAPEAGPPIELEFAARYTGPEFETLRFLFQDSSQTNIDWRDAVDVPGATYAFVQYQAAGGRVLWVRRPSSQSGEPVAGNIFAGVDGGPGVRFALRTKPGAAPSASNQALEYESFVALADIAEDDPAGSSPLTPFMNRRLRDMAKFPARPAPGRGVFVPIPPPVGESDLRVFMDTTTGRSAIQQAIQSDYQLAIRMARDPKKLPLSAAAPPALPRADYAAMLAALGRTPPSEPLAQAAPADFWFLRARTFEAFFELYELTERWGQPTADLLGGQSEDRGTSARYTAELGLERTELARVLGPSVIESLAVVGSDPYVHDGTDVTFVFKVKAPPLFEAALVKALGRHAEAHGGVKTSELVHEGVTIRIARSPDGRVRQHRASVAGLELVSNSPAAVRRVISTALGKAPRLADEKDFQYLVARDAGTPDELLAFLSDRFVLNVVGPAQKIAQARRQIALAELSTPGFAALLFGWLNGRSPKDEKELLKGGELLAAELRHTDGAAIVWQPGKPASSRWGTTTDLEPLIDLPPVEKISPTERDAYTAFANEYRNLWSEYVDPVILRIARSKDTPGRIDAALRALPLLRADNRDLIEMVGWARVDVPPLDAGLRWVLAIGKDAALRRELDGRAHFGVHALKFDWLGDSVMLGIADRSELARATKAALSRKLEPPTHETRNKDEFEGLVELPAYAVVEVKNRVGAVVMLGALRKLTSDLGRDMLEWREGGKHRDVAITDVAIMPSGLFREGAHLYYALCPKALIFSLNRAVLTRLIDDQLDGRAPRGVADATPRSPRGGTRRSDAGQFVYELGAKKDGALIRVIGWLAAAELAGRSYDRAKAEAILRGAPESRSSPDAFKTLARAYLGHVPLTPDGNLYEFSPEGIKDPVRGTTYAPIFPPTPVPGSPLDTVLSRFARMRSSISFDSEPGTNNRARDARSFSARVSLELRP